MQGTAVERPLKRFNCLGARMSPAEAKYAGDGITHITYLRALLLGTALMKSLTMNKGYVYLRATTEVGTMLLEASHGFPKEAISTKSRLIKAQTYTFL